MQVSFAISSVLHVALLSWALFSFEGPKSLDVADVEAVPVAIIPFEDITQVVQGREEANNKNVPAPEPTQSRAIVEDAQNIGENEVDLKSIEAPVPSENEVVSKAPPKSEPEPAPPPEPESSPEPSPDVLPKEPSESTTATEIAALPQEAAPAEADPVADAIKTTEAVPQEQVSLPKTGPVPVFRQQVAPAATAKSPARKKTEISSQNNASERQSEFNSDEIASLLNREDSQGGGAKRSQRDAGLGAETTRSAAKLSQSEMDALRSQIQNKWNIIPGLADGGEIRVTVSMQLDKSGNIIGQPDVTATGGSDATRRTLAGSARRAVLRAQPYDLPLDKYETWSQVVVNFDPSELF